MPLVASNGGDEAFGSPSRFGDGVDHLFVAALVASGVRRAGDNATRRLIDARSSVVEPLQSAGGGRPVGGRSRSTAGEMELTGVSTTSTAPKGAEPRTRRRT